MYTLVLNQKTQQFILINEKTKEQIKLFGLGDVGEVYFLLREQLEAAQALRMLTVKEMLNYARANGAPDIISQTVTNACNRNAIPNTIKREGRWYAPEPAFHEWFNRFIARRSSGDGRYSGNQQ